MNEIIITINSVLVSEYEKYYFSKYPRRKKFPIKGPIPLSLNEWMVMPRFKANNIKQAWKEFGEWVVDKHGFSGRNIKSCDIVVTYYFKYDRRHDPDNYFPKNLSDAFVSSGLLEDDDFKHVQSLQIRGGHCKENPRIEFLFTNIEE